jgi:hypothetical protein
MGHPSSWQGEFLKSGSHTLKRHPSRQYTARLTAKAVPFQAFFPPHLFIPNERPARRVLPEALLKWKPAERAPWLPSGMNCRVLSMN